MLPLEPADTGRRSVDAVKAAPPPPASTAPGGSGIAFAKADTPARVTLQAGPDKATPPIDPKTLLKISDLLDDGTVGAAAPGQLSGSGRTVAAPPRTVDHPKYSTVDLATIAKNIPGAQFMKETYHDGSVAEVIRAQSGTPIIRKFIDPDGRKIIESYMEPEELAYALRKLPKGQLDLVTDVLNGQVGTISPKTVRDYEQAQQVKQIEAQRLAQVFAAASSLPAPTAAINFNKDQTIGVGQHELGITNAKSSKPILGSFGAGPCLIVAIYNRETKSASLAHIDSLTPDSELSSMISSTRGTPKQPLEIHIAGGDPSSREQVSRLIDLTRKQPNAKIVTADIGPSQASRSLAIDSRTGEVTTQFSYEQLDLGPNFDERANLLQFQLQSRPLDIVNDSRIPQKAR